MHLRVERQQENAIRVAEFLKAHPVVTQVCMRVVLVNAGNDAVLSKHFQSSSRSFRQNRSPTSCSNDKSDTTLPRTGPTSGDV